MAQLVHAAAELAIAPLNWLFQLACLLCAWIGLLQGRKRSPAPKSVLITGATSGIGEALAVHYANAGVVLSLTGRNREALERVAASCRAKGATVATRAGDVADGPAAGSGVRNEFAAWIRERDRAAPLDLVIANAGINEDTSGADKDLEGAARAIFSVNVEGVFNTVFPALEGMRARGSGQIALMASLASFGALTGSAAYSASKAAVRIYGDGLRAQLAREGIRVSTICPGFVETRMTAGSKFKQPFKLGVEEAVRRIATGLALNDANINFPLMTTLLSRTLAGWPSAVRDFVARNRLVPAISYLRKSRAAAAGRAVAAPPAGADAAPVGAAAGAGSSSANSSAAAYSTANEAAAEAPASRKGASGGRRKHH